MEVGVATIFNYLDTSKHSNSYQLAIYKYTKVNFL